MRKQSRLDDLHCYDGEVEGADWLFPDLPGSGKKDPDSTEDVTEVPELGQAVMSVPAGVNILLVHRVSDESDKSANLIFTDAEGNLMWTDTRNSIPLKIASKSETGIVREAVDIGDILTVLSEKGLLYALWSEDNSEYIWLGKAPKAPSPDVQIISKSLLPYSVVDGDLPSIVAEIKADNEEAEAILNWLSGREGPRCPIDLRTRVKKAVSESLKAFLEDVKNAGLWFQDLFISFAWMSQDVEWQHSFPTKVHETDDLKLRISETSFSDGIFRIRLTLSQSPYCVRVEDPTVALSSGWKRIIDGTGCYVSHERSLINPSALSDAVSLDSSSRGFELYRISDVLEDPRNLEMSRIATIDADSPTLIYTSGSTVFKTLKYFGLSETTPDFITNINSCLVSITTIGGLFKRNMISVSAPFLPMAVHGENELGGEKILKVMHSLRPLSSGQLGEFPLHAFAADGIRALSPKNDSFVDVQLISRDVPGAIHGFAPLPEGTAFLSARGVMEIEGTNVKCVSDTLEKQTGDKWNFEQGDFLAYDYPSNTLILYNPGRGAAVVFMRTTGRWTKVDWCPDSHVYFWPLLLVKSGNEIKRLFRKSQQETLQEASPMIPVVLTSDFMTVTTRPIKFSAPFDVKKLKRVELIWPDGERLPFVVYGALRPGLWRVLGRSQGGPIHLEGSGWRFFKLDVTLKRPENLNYEEIISISKPLIMFEFQKYD